MPIRHRYMQRRSLPLDYSSLEMTWVLFEEQDVENKNKRVQSGEKDD